MYEDDIDPSDHEYDDTIRSTDPTLEHPLGRLDPSDPRLDRDPQ